MVVWRPGQFDLKRNGRPGSAARPERRAGAGAPGWANRGRRPGRLPNVCRAALSFLDSARSNATTSTSTTITPSPSAPGARLACLPACPALSLLSITCA